MTTKIKALSKPIDLNVPVAPLCEVQDLARDNEFLARMVSSVLAAGNYRRFFFKNSQARAAVRILRRCGAVEDIRSVKDIQARPGLFWDMVEAARAENPSPGLTSELRAVCCIFRKLIHTFNFGAAYCHHEKSIVDAVIRGKILDVVTDPRTNRDTYFAVTWRGPEAVRYPVVMAYESRYLRSRVLKTVDGRNIYAYMNSAERLSSIVASFERFFPNSASITTHHDFTPERLERAVCAVNSLVDERRERRCCMQLVFFLWLDLMEDFPAHDFFKGSRVFIADAVINSSTPLLLADGYIPVVAGRAADVEAYERVLFLVNHNMLRTANGQYYAQYTADFSRIKDPVWRKAVVAFAYESVSCGDRTRYDIVQRTIVPWLDGRGDVAEPYHVHQCDVRALKEKVLATDILTRTKAANFRATCSFLQWAADMGYITVDPDAFSGVRPIKAPYNPNPKTVPAEDIRKVVAALRDMGEEDPRYALAACVVNIQLRSEVRPGQILAMMLPMLRFEADGTCVSHQIAKNSGKDRRPNYFSASATEFIRDAIEISRSLRRKCPSGHTRNCIFIYASRQHSRWKYLKMSTTNYNKTIADACEWAGVQKFTSGNIRDTFITAAKRLAKKMGLTKQAACSLVGHSNAMSANAYYEIDMRDILDAAKDVSLGGVINKEAIDNDPDNEKL